MLVLETKSLSSARAANESLSHLSSPWLFFFFFECLLSLLFLRGSWLWILLELLMCDIVIFCRCSLGGFVVVVVVELSIIFTWYEFGVCVSLNSLDT